MNARLHDSLPRFDSGEAGMIDIAQLGEPRMDGKALYLPKLGREITSDAELKARMARNYSRVWHKPVEDRVVQDAATNFATNALNLQLPSSEDVRRPTDDQYIFVPAAGRTPALPSKNLLKPGYRTNSYNIRTRSGSADFVNPAAGFKQLQNASYSKEEKVQGAEYYASMWEHTIFDDWEANIVGDDDLGEKQAASTEALDDMRERLSGLGDVGKKLPGFMRLGDAGQLFGGTTFAVGTVIALNQMLKLAHFDQVYMNANKGVRATRLLAPLADQVAMQTTFFGTDAVGESVWDRAIKIYPWLANAIWDRRMATASVSSLTRWVLYTDDPKNLYIEHTETMLFNVMNGLVNTFYQLRRHGGVVNKIPERVFYIDFAAS